MEASTTDDNLYGDLEFLSKNAEIDELKTQLEEKEKKLDEASKEIEQLRSQLVLLVEEKKVMEKNMLSIYHTALNEIKRKDREIAELRKSNRP
jgi:predicted  nucleic acid-binding Zn-ribbon protein